MKRLKVNTTWAEDEEERVKFYANLSYKERMRYFLQLRSFTYTPEKAEGYKRTLKIYRSNDAI